MITYPDALFHLTHLLEERIATRRLKISFAIKAPTRAMSRSSWVASKIHALEIRSLITAIRLISTVEKASRLG